MMTIQKHSSTVYFTHLHCLLLNYSTKNKKQIKLFKAHEQLIFKKHHRLKILNGNVKQTIDDIGTSLSDHRLKMDERQHSLV